MYTVYILFYLLTVTEAKEAVCLFRFCQLLCLFSFLILENKHSAFSADDI